MAAVQPHTPKNVIDTLIQAPKPFGENATLVLLDVDDTLNFVGGSDLNQHLMAQLERLKGIPNVHVCLFTKMAVTDVRKEIDEARLGRIQIMTRLKDLGIDVEQVLMPGDLANFEIEHTIASQKKNCNQQINITGTLNEHNRNQLLNLRTIESTLLALKCDLPENPIPPLESTKATIDKYLETLIKIKETQEPEKKLEMYRNILEGMENIRERALVVYSPLSTINSLGNYLKSLINDEKKPDYKTILETCINAKNAQREYGNGFYTTQEIEKVEAIIQQLQLMQAQEKEEHQEISQPLQAYIDRWSNQDKEEEQQEISPDSLETQLEFWSNIMQSSRIAYAQAINPNVYGFLQQLPTLTSMANVRKSEEIQADSHYCAGSSFRDYYLPAYAEGMKEKSTQTAEFQRIRDLSGVFFDRNEEESQAFLSYERELEAYDKGPLIDAIFKDAAKRGLPARIVLFDDLDQCVKSVGLRIKDHNKRLEITQHIEFLGVPLRARSKDQVADLDGKNIADAIKYIRSCDLRATLQDCKQELEQAMLNHKSLNSPMSNAPKILEIFEQTLNNLDATPQEIGSALLTAQQLSNKSSGSFLRSNTFFKHAFSDESRKVYQNLNNDIDRTIKLNLKAISGVLPKCQVEEERQSFKIG